MSGRSLDDNLIRVSLRAKRGNLICMSLRAKRGNLIKRNFLHHNHIKEGTK